MEKRSGLKDATATATDTADPARRAVYLTQAEDITPMLKVMRDHSAELELRLPGVTDAYRGRILDIGDDHFLIEDIRPREGIKHMRRGARFTFSARADDLYVCGEDCRISRVESERGLPYFHASLPQRLLRHRRRRHNRITLPPRVSPDEGIARITRDVSEASALHGQIIDISVGGCRIAFSGAVMPPLCADERLPGCEVRVTSSLGFTAEAIVRHSAWDAGKRQTICGLEFLRMAIADRRRLEHYVSQLSARPSLARSG